MAFNSAGEFHCRGFGGVSEAEIMSDKRLLHVLFERLGEKKALSAKVVVTE